MQLHLYDLVAVRKQQMGTAQPLKRTRRSALADAATRTALESYPAFPQGKENTPASGLNSGQTLALPLHNAQPNKGKQGGSLLTQGTSDRCLADCEPAMCKVTVPGIPLSERYQKRN